MTTFNTGNSVPSTDGRDLSDNAETIDELVDSSLFSTTTRTGKVVLTRKGLEAQYVFTAINNGVWAEFETFTAVNQYMVFSGTAYKPRNDTTLPYVVGATPVGDANVEVVGNLSTAQGDQRYDKKLDLAAATADLSALVGMTIRVTDRLDGLFDWVSGETANTFNIIDHDSLPIQLKLRDQSFLDTRTLGAVNGADISAILTNAISLNSQVLIKDLSIKINGVQAVNNLRLLILNSTLSPTSGLTGGTLNAPHKMIDGAGLNNFQIMGVNSKIEASEYYPASTTHPVDGVYERVSGIHLTNCKGVLIEGFNFDQMSHSSIVCVQTTTDGMSNIKVRDITGEKPNYAFKAIFVGGEIEASKSKDVTIQDIVLNGGGRVPTELGEDAGFNFGTSSVDHVQVKNCDQPRLDKISSTFAMGIGVRVEKCIDTNDSSIVVQESGQSGLQYYNTGTLGGQSSQPIVKRWGRIPDLTNVRMFGGTPFLMIEAVANNTVADPSADDRFIPSPYTIANTAGIPAYDTALTGSLIPFRGYGGVDVVHKAILINVDNPLCRPATEKTGATFDYASDHGFNMIHSNNAPIAEPTIARLTNGARIEGNMNNLNAPQFSEPVNGGLSNTALRVSSIPDEPNSLFNVNDFGTTYHVTGGLSGVDRSRMSRTDILSVHDQNESGFIELWVPDGTKIVGLRVIRADDANKFIQLNFGDENVTFGFNGVNSFIIDSAGGRDLP